MNFNIDQPNRQTAAYAQGYYTYETQQYSLGISQIRTS